MRRLLEGLGFSGIVLLLLCSGPVPAATLRVEVRGSGLEIQADGVPLGDVLAAVSAKTGLVVKAGEALTEAVTCRFTGLTLEEGVRRLMKNRSYALICAETKGPASRPPELWILGTNGPGFLLGSTASPLGTLSATAPEGLAPPEDHTNRYRKDWLAGEVANREQLARQFSARPSGAQTEERGIVITKLAPDSLLQKIGIDQGDLVSRVNGRPVGTVREFISAFQSVPQEPSSIMMIERRKPDGRLDPVYVHLE